MEEVVKSVAGPWPSGPSAGLIDCVAGESCRSDRRPRKERGESRGGRGDRQDQRQKQLLHRILRQMFHRGTFGAAWCRQTPERFGESSVKSRVLEAVGTIRRPSIP